MDWQDRLDVENFLRAFVRAGVEVGVALKWDAVEVADRVLQFLGKIGFALRLRGGQAAGPRRSARCR
jgi:hypothetical protein